MEGIEIFEGIEGTGIFCGTYEVSLVEISNIQK